MIGKPALLRLHRYVGLAAAAFLFVQALTGLTLVFGPQLAQLLDPSGMTSGIGSGDATAATLLGAAEGRFPGYRADRLVYPDTADGTYLVHLDDGEAGKKYVSLDRHDATIRREGSIWRFPVVAALNIHDQWLSGVAGTIVVAVAGLLLLGLAGTGLAFWWPRRGRIRKSLAVQRHLAPRLVLRQVHRTAGAVLSALLAFVALTGLFLAVPMVLDGPAPHWTSTEPFAPRLEPALALARARFPGHAVRDIRMQGPTRIAVFLHAPERNSRAVHRVVVDTRGPRIESVLGAFDNREAWVIALPLHSGSVLGLSGRLVILAGGLALAFLALTGPLMWYQARRARRRPAGAPPRKPARIDAGTIA
jgi:uncharacterized iron-regulated membrane protein